MASFSHRMMAKSDWKMILNALRTVAFTISFDIYCPKMHKESHISLRYFVPISEVDANFLSRLAIMLNRGTHFIKDKKDFYTVGLNSSISPDRSFQLLMLDFDLKDKAKILKAMDSIKIKNWKNEIINPSGFIIRTGHGYHFLGVDRMKDEVWRHTLREELRDEPIIDQNHLKVSLKVDFATLRICSSKNKKNIPKITNIIDPYGIIEHRQDFYYRNIEIIDLIAEQSHKDVVTRANAVKKYITIDMKKVKARASAEQYKAVQEYGRTKIKKLKGMQEDQP